MKHAKTLYPGMACRRHYRQAEIKVLDEHRKRYIATPKNPKADKILNINHDLNQWEVAQWSVRWILTSYHITHFSNTVLANSCEGKHFLCSNKSAAHTAYECVCVWWGWSEFAVTCVCKQDFLSAVDVVPPIDRSIYYIFMLGLREWRCCTHTVHTRLYLKSVCEVDATQVTAISSLCRAPLIDLQGFGYDLEWFFSRGGVGLGSSIWPNYWVNVSTAL